MRKFKDPRNTQRFLSTMEVFLNLLKVGGYKHPAGKYREKLKNVYYIFDEFVSSSHHYV
jgi:putative transposase